MRLLKHRLFSRWAKEEDLSDPELSKALKEIEEGLFEANLGSGLYKKRIAREGQGKRDGYRTLLAFKQNDKAIFVYGFAKNERGNISHKEQDVYKRLAKCYLALTRVQIDSLIKNGELIEVNL